MFKIPPEIKIEIGPRLSRVLGLFLVLSFILSLIVLWALSGAVVELWGGL